MDISLNYEIKGEGFPLVLLHGNGEDHTYFKNQICCLAKYRKVIALDTRGHGASPKGSAPFTLKQFAKDLYDFLTEHNISKADILGFSDGANIALYFALEHQDMVARLILNGANINPSGVKRRYQVPIVLGYRLSKLFKKAKDNTDMLRLMVKEPYISPQQLSQLSLETLVIAGKRDMIKKRHTILIGASIPGAKTVFIKGNHFIASKHPESFNKEVIEFLEKAR